MAVHGGPKVAAPDGLVASIDASNQKSISNGSFLNLLNSNSLSNPTWANGASQITIVSLIEILGNDTNYAYHPINKWNTGTGTASFVLYHFQNYQGNSPNSANLLRWYANSGGTWRGISSSYKATPGNTYFLVLQYNSTSGGQLWINNSKIGGRGGGGILGSGTSTVSIDGDVNGRFGIHKVKMSKFYNKELNDNEILQMYNLFKNRI